MMFLDLRYIFSQRRYMIAFLAFFGYVSMYSLRINVSMAIVEMTSNKTVLLANGTLIKHPEFDWNSEDKSLILSAFAFGYIFTAVGGVIASKFGGATVFGVGIALTAIATCLTPYLVLLDFKWFVASRIIEGVFEAVAYSSMFELWSKWSPPEECSRLVSFSFTGSFVGLTLSYPVSGFVAGIWGWPAIFYATGGAALIWAVLWLILVKNDPASDKSLSNTERLFLAERMNITEDVEIVYPWNDILTSVPVWTLCIVELIFSCGYTLILLYLPLYIKDISNVDLSSIGVLSALPQLCGVVSHPLAGYLADYVKNRRILNSTQIHKLYICGAFSIGAVLLNVAAFWPNFTSVIVSLSIFGLCFGFVDVSFQVSGMDLSPKYSSLLIGVSNSFFTLGCILSPLFIGKMVQHHSQSEWSSCYVSISVIYVFGAVLYFKYGSGEVQWWNNSPFFGYMSMYSLRTNLSMAIVEMTSNKTVLLANGTSIKRPEFDWNSKDKSLVLSAFSYGYIFTIQGGVMARKFGGATVFGVGIALTAMSTCLTPYLVYLDFKWFIASRIIEGLFEAIALSSAFELWYNWFPPEERSRLVSYSFTGAYVGLTMSYPVSGFVASVWGWPAIFYTTGGVAMIWAVMWLILVENDPASDKSLSNTERLFLAQSMKITKDVQIVYPWNDILTSVPVWTLCTVKFVFSCGYTIIMYYLPLYIKDTSNIDINSIGILSALPHLCAVMSHPLAGYLADYVRNEGILNATQTHKLYICGGFSIGAVLLNVAAFWPNLTSVIFSLSVFRLFTSFTDVSFQINAIDLSPKYSSLLYGFSNSFFTIGSILSPLFIGVMVQHHSHNEWSSCFVTFSVMYVFGAVLYFICGSGELQLWYDSCQSANEDEKCENKMEGLHIRKKRNVFCRKFNTFFK